MSDRGQIPAHILAVLGPAAIYMLVGELLSQLLDTVIHDLVLRQGCCSLAGLLALLCYERCRRGAKDSKRPFHRKGDFRHAVVSVLLLMTGSIAMNQLLLFSGIVQSSPSYQSLQQNFYSSSLVRELLVFGLVTPLAEEILYRGIVYRELAQWLGKKQAILLSAVLFGAFHANLVQFLYAGALGIALGLLRANYGSLWFPVLGHVSANLVSLLRGTTGLFTFLSSESSMYIQVTIGCAAVSLFLTGCLIVRFYRME